MKIYDVNKNDIFSCIYLWRNLINNKVYVGQAQNFYRRMCEYKRGCESERLIGKAINKYGIDNFDIEILEKNIPIDLLSQREIYWIKYYNSCIYFENGYGYNMTAGGEGSIGMKHSEETKKILSEKKLGKGKAVMCVDTGIVYENIFEALKTINVKSVSGIRKCCNGDAVTSGGYHWKYADDENWQMPIDHNIHWVICIETKEQYQSIKEAFRITGINACSIAEYCRGTQKTAGGYHWKYLNDNSWVMPEDKKTNAKKIICVNTNTVYNSIKEASADMNIGSGLICSCCKQQISSAKGYIFEYAL